MWFYSGGMRGFSSFFGYNEIRSMSGRYASYWNAFLFQYFFKQQEDVTRQVFEEMSALYEQNQTEV